MEEIAEGTCTLCTREDATIRTTICLNDTTSNCEAPYMLLEIPMCRWCTHELITASDKAEAVECLDPQCPNDACQQRTREQVPQ